MSMSIHLGLGTALFVAALAAFWDWRSGTIPNWLTLPPLAAAPIAYGVLLSPHLAMQCFIAAFLSGIGPYWAFRLGGMGGGDVKLFAALGSVVGFDPFAGLEIQLLAFALALLGAVFALMWRGRLFTTLEALRGWRMNRPTLTGVDTGRRHQLIAPIRMGGAVFAATVIHVAPYLASVRGSW